MLKTLYLIRHGDVPPEYHGRYLGHRTNPPLADTESQRLLPLGKLTCGLVLVSPSRRAMETAQFLNAPRLIDPRLREIDFGRWDNKTFAEIEPEADAETLRLWGEESPLLRFPDGESIAEFFARIDDFTADLVKREEEAIAVVTHCWVIGRLHENLTLLHPESGRKRVERGEVLHLIREESRWKEISK